MSAEPVHSPDARVDAALGDLRASILKRYPDARFRVSGGEDDPAIVQLVATVDVDDTDQVLDVVMDRVLDLQEQGLPIFVVTERPVERTFRLLEAARTARANAGTTPRA
jgi:hypothetical protein